MGGSWDSAAVSLSEAQRVRLFTVVFFSKSKPSSPLQHGLPRDWRQVLSNFYPSRTQRTTTFEAEADGNSSIQRGDSW